MQKCPDSNSAQPASVTWRKRGFTLTEMLVVIGIIVLFIVLAVPAINAITGTRSISAAENNLSSLLARAREEAIGIQEVRGVMFYLDPRTDGVVGLIVRPADIQNSGVLLLDTVANRDALALPRGVRLQTIFDGGRSNTNNRYLGYNLYSDTDPAFPAKFGGVILFDGEGRLTIRPYGFQLTGPDDSTGTKPPSGLAQILHVTTGGIYIPFVGNVLRANSFPPYSQLGLALFDRKTFQGAGFGDGDPDLDGSSVETGEEKWIDDNSTPLLINRYAGTLIRGE